MATAVIVNGKPHPRLYWRGNTIWYQGPDPSGRGKAVRLTTGCKDPEAAALKAKEFEHSAASPAYRASYESSLAGGIQLWLAHCRAQGLKQVTMKSKAEKIGHFITLWGADLPLVRITAKLTSEYWMARQTHVVDKAGKRTVQPLTVQRELEELRGMLKHLSFLGLYSTPLEAVFSDAFKGETTDHSWKFPSREEVAKLLAVLKPAYAARVAFAVATSCRFGETWRAAREHVVNDKEGRIVKIAATKTKHAQQFATEIPILEELVGGLLDFALDNAPNHTGTLFGRCDYSSAKYWLDTACKRAGIPCYTWNDFRRAAPNWVLQDGIGDELLASKMLRHVDTKMLRHYAKTMMANPHRIRKLAKVQLAQARVAGLDLRPAQLPALSAANSLEPACTRSVRTIPERSETQETQETGKLYLFNAGPKSSGGMVPPTDSGSALAEIAAKYQASTQESPAWCTAFVRDLYAGPPIGEA